MSENKPSRSSQKTILISIISVLVLIILGLAGYLIFSGAGNKLAKLKQQGSNYLMQEDYGRAKEEFKKALELSPEDIVIYFDLAEAYIGLEDYIDAAVYLEQALAVAETVKTGETVNTDQYVSLTVKLAECYSKTGEDHKKVELLKHSMEVTGSDRIKDLLTAYYPESVTADRADGDYEVEEALEVGLSGSGMIYYTLDGTVPTAGSMVYSSELSLPAGTYEINAISFNEYGFGSEVSTFRYTVKEVDYLNRAIELVLNKDYDLALEDFKKVISVDEKEPKAYYGMAKVYIAKGEYSAAVEAVKLGLSFGADKDLQDLLSELVPTVEASLAPGVYTSDRKLTLELKGYGKVIHYTTDGSIPDLNSPVYQEPIPLEKGSNLITASALSTFGIFGKVVTFEYTVSYKQITVQQPTEDNRNSDTADSEKTGEEETSAEEKQATADESGEIIWADESVESVVRKALGKDTGAISVEEAGTIDGALDLSEVQVTSLADLVWLKKFSTLSIRGSDLTDAKLVNSLPVDRVIAVYHNMDEIKAIDNTEVLQRIDHFGISVGDFSLGDMTITEMLDFIGEMNRLMQELTNLEYLDLSNNGLTDINLIGEINNLSNVKFLILRNNEIVDLSVLTNFTKLIYLDITGNPIKDFTPVEHVDTIIGKQ